MSKRPHEDLKIWRMAMEVVNEIYELTKKFPMNEKYGLVIQMRRSAISIPSNIAEGASRHSKSEFVQFLYIARGSLSELETELLISLKQGYISSKRCKTIMDKTDSVGKMLTSLIKRMDKG